MLTPIRCRGYAVAYDEKTAARVRLLLAARGDVVETKLMGGLCFMVGGNMACSVSARGGLLVRVGPGGVASALRQPHVNQMRMGARAMSGFVRVDPEGYRTDAALRKWVQRGVDFAASLPTKNKGTSRKR